jgi:hypothetical protein
MTTTSDKPVLINVLGGAPEPDGPLEEALSHGAPIRLRLLATVLVGGTHVGLPGVRWIADFPSIASVQAFYRDLDVHVRAWMEQQG